MIQDLVNLVFMNKRSFFDNFKEIFLNYGTSMFMTHTIFASQGFTILFVWNLDVYLNLKVYFMDVEAHAETGFTRLHLEKDNFPKDKYNKKIYTHLTTHISSKSLIYISI